MKIIAFYLPQFHNIPENDEWWGNGFTEWTNVKKAKPLYEGHMQPRVPLGGNYYNLLDDNVKIWQADLAKKYGVYGFCYYHYWFNGKMLLEKPMEQMLANKEVDIPFCICWANEPWTKAWVGDEKKMLIAQEYGQEEEWKQHFMYLLPFFKDERYITKDGKPLFVFYRPDIVPCMKEMIETWDKLAKENGLSGITFAFQSGDYDWNNSKEAKLFDYDIEFQPPYASHWLYSNDGKIISALKKCRRLLAGWAGKKFGIDLYRYGTAQYKKMTGQTVANYDSMWQKIIEAKPMRSNSIPGAFVKWDNTPRHGERGQINVGTPEKFEYYLSKQIKHAREDYHEDMIFMYAWNEWAEGGYLEPDEDDKYGYLEAIKRALEENNEFPEFQNKKNENDEVK